MSADDDQYRTCLTTNVVTGTPDVCEEAENLSDESDDTADVWDDEDFRLVEPMSTVSYWSKPDEFAEVLSTPNHEPRSKS